MLLLQVSSNDDVCAFHHFFIPSDFDNKTNYDTSIKGLALLRLLKIDIPSEPSPSTVMSAMSQTERVASAYSFQQITNTRHIVDEKKRKAMKCVNALVISMFRSASPYFPLVGCAFVNYSLHNGVVEESAPAFLVFGYCKIALVRGFKTFGEF